MLTLVHARVLTGREEAGFDFVERRVPCDRHRIVDQASDAAELDLTGCLLLPCFFNAHCHLGESLYQGIDGQDWTLSRYLDWTERIQRQMSAAERERTWEESARATRDAMIKHGSVGFCAGRAAVMATDSVCCMAGYPLMLTEKLRHYYAAGVPGFLAYQTQCSSELCNVGLFVHSLYMNDAKVLELAAKAMALGAGFVTMHVAEDAESFKREQKRFGANPLTVLREHALLDSRTLLVHGGAFSQRDFEEVAEARAYLAVCPLSNLFLHCPLPDVPLMEELGLPWVLGTDGLATGRTLSLVAQAQKLLEIFPMLSPTSLFAAMTTRPARLFKRPVYTGCIEPGTISSFLVLRDQGKKSFEEVFLDLVSGHLAFRVLTL